MENFFSAESGDDYVFVENLSAHCRIGTTEEEKNTSQEIKISFKVPVNSRLAAEEDDLSQTVDYNRVGRWLVGRAESISCSLLETLAHRLASGAKSEFDLPQIELTLEKPEIYSGKTCPGITVRR